MASLPAPPVDLSKPNICTPLRCSYPPEVVSSPDWYSQAVESLEARGVYGPLYALHKARILDRLERLAPVEPESEAA